MRYDELVPKAAISTILSIRSIPLQFSGDFRDQTEKELQCLVVLQCFIEYLVC